MKRIGLSGYAALAAQVNEAVITAAHVARTFARDEEIEVAIQINGKLRSRIFASANASDSELREAALSDDRVKNAIEGRVVAKIITVPGKLVNVVLK